LDNGAKHIDAYEPQAQNRTNGTWGVLSENHGKREEVTLWNRAVVAKNNAVKAGFLEFKYDHACTSDLDKNMFVLSRNPGGVRLNTKETGENNLLAVAYCSGFQMLSHPASIASDPKARRTKALTQLQKQNSVIVFWGPAVLQIAGEATVAGNYSQVAVDRWTCNHLSLHRSAFKADGRDTVPLNTNWFHSSTHAASQAPVRLRDENRSDLVVFNEVWFTKSYFPWTQSGFMIFRGHVADRWLDIGVNNGLLAR